VAPTTGLGELGGLGGAVSAALGRGTALGALAVPPSWDAIAPTTSPIAPLLGGAPISAPAAVPGMPGMPAVNAAGNHLNGSAPKYGLRPTVMVHSPAAG
jgi:PPE-repeat protein